MSEGATRSETAERVARYYDRNTGRFLLFGGSRGSYSIHRELWGPGVASAQEAVAYANRLVADEIERLPIDEGLAICDFGCGVGGSLFHLAERFPDSDLHGITVSPRQVEIAKRLATKLGLDDRCSFSTGDFTTTRFSFRANVVVAIESLSHAPSPDAFFAGAVDHLQPHGRVIVLDDFLSADEETLDTRTRLALHRFRTGWRLPALGTMERLVERADRWGLVPEKAVDLTPFVRPFSRVRDHVVAFVAPVVARLGLTGIPFCGNLVGGHGLQVGLIEGALRYRMTVLRRVP